MADDVDNTLPTNQIDERQTLEELTQLGRETADSDMPDVSGVEEVTTIVEATDNQITLQNAHQGSSDDAVANLVSGILDSDQSEIIDVLERAHEIAGTLLDDAELGLGNLSFRTQISAPNSPSHRTPSTLRATR